MKKQLLHISFFLIILIVPASLNGQTTTATFEETVTQADLYFEQGDYINAKVSYQYALKQDPDDEYARARLQESLEMIKIQQEKSMQFTRRVMIADDLFNQKKYEEALAEYKKSLAIIENDRYALGRTNEIENILEERRRNEQEFHENFNLGEEAFSNGDYAAATGYYKKASAIRPGDEKVKERIRESEQLLAENLAALDEYNTALQTAEQFIARNAYDNAIGQLETAITLRPDEPGPVKRLEEVRSLKKAYDAYSAVVEAGDAFYMNKEFEKAREKYQEALKIQPDDNHVKNLLNRTNIAIADIESLKNANFEETLALAEELFSQEDYDQAMEEYKKALRMKPDQAYIKKKIDEITQIVSLRQTQQQAYEQAVARGDKLFQEEDYQQSLAEYQKANELKPLERYPKVKIQEVNDLIADLKSKRETYNSLITGADKLFFADDYAEAREQYQRALDLFSSEAYPRDQITMINEIIGQRDKYIKALTRADQLFATGDYAAALPEYRSAAEIHPDELYPREKIDEIDSLMAEEMRLQEIAEQYDQLVTRADRLFERKEYEEALALYRDALNVKPGETYPGDQITAIATLTAEVEFNARFDSVMQRGEELFSRGELEPALAAFNEALTMKPADPDAAQRKEEVTALMEQQEKEEELMARYREIISGADRLRENEEYEEALAGYTEALSLRPGESYPKEQIRGIKDLQAERNAMERLEREYERAISEGDRLLASGDPAGAIARYEEASGLKPDEEYPKEKIQEARAAYEVLMQQRETDSSYLAAITFADKHFSEGEYEAARREYKVANSIKPSEDYPLGQLAEIDRILNEKERQAEIDRKYNAVVEKADAFFKEEKFHDALTAYQEAKGIKPGDPYPPARILETKNELDQRSEETEKAFDLAITKGDNFYNEQKWDMAKLHYATALELLPDSDYARERLKETNDKILLERRLVQEDYDKAIADADKLYASKIYDEAIEAYRKAARLKSSEEYPVAMIRRILKLLSERSIVDLNKDPLVIENNQTHKFDFIPVNVQDRKGNYMFFKARNLSDSDYKLIVSYGKGSAKNGGFVVRIPPSSAEEEFIIRISAQYKWFSDDNNWITFYPEGGDIQVSQVQISHSD